MADMNISKYGKASLMILGFQVAADVLTTGGVGTIATLGLSSGVLLSLKETLAGVFPGLLTHQLAKASDEFSEASLEKAFEKAISNTLESVKRDFFSNEAYRVTLKDRLDHLLGSGVPSEEILNQKLLEKYYFQPLYQAFQDDKMIEKIINNNEHLKPGELIAEIIRANNLQLPQYKAEQQKLIFKALTEGFNERFLHDFNKELKTNKQAETVYHTHLLHCAMKQLEQLDLGQKEIQHNLQTLLDFANRQTIYLQDIIGQNEQIARHQKDLNQEFEKFREDFLHSRSLLLPVHREKKKDPRDQFKYESVFTDFTGREQELELFRSFLADDRKFCWYMLSGEGGTGKSRLANEICLRAEAMGWIAGFSNLTQNKDFSWETLAPPANMLLVFDYVKARPEEVERILGILASIEGLQYKVRMLLIDRQFDKELIERLANSKTRYDYYTYPENQEEQPYHLTSLEEEARWDIIKQLVRGKEHEGQILSRKDEIIAQLDAQDPLKRPLFAFFSGVALAEGQDIKNWNVKDNLRYHLQRQEHNIWSQIKLWKKHEPSIKNLIWLATISEYLNYQDILQVMNEFNHLLDFQRNTAGHLMDKDFRQLEELFLFIREKQDDLTEGDYLGIKPDLLGEYFIVTHLQKLLDDKRYNALAFPLVQAAWHIRAERVWWMTYLTFQNFHETAGLQWMVRCITAADFSEKEGVTPFIAQFFFGLGILYWEQQQWKKAEQYYLQAIEKGQVEALNNLANLYQNQQQWKKAEQYYLQAIEKGHVDAMYNLVVLYYQLNVKKDLAFKLMEVLVPHKPDVQTKLLIVVISVWAGKDDYYQQHREEVLAEIIRVAPTLLVTYLTMILYHDHSDFVLNQFEKGPHKEYLHQNVELVYYVALFFSRPESEQLAHIPEKMKEEFEQLVEHIKEKRAFYAN